MDDTVSCREQAAKAREIAERMMSPPDKAAWLGVAEEWLKLAESAEADARRLLSPIQIATEHDLK
jgi:hypothetical protein